jgi:hypothetical protein
VAQVSQSKALFASSGYDIGIIINIHVITSTFCQ